MDRRLRLATMVAVFVALALLGVPCAVFASQTSQRATLQEVDSRCERAASFVDSAANVDLEVTANNLDRFTGRSARGPSAHITVTRQHAVLAEAGPSLKEPLREEYFPTSSGALVTCQVSWWAVQANALPAVGLVVLAGVVALIAAALVARYQASRLSKPLLYLAASAEQLGAGRVRPQLKPSGIEEIDLVADELARSADRMARRLAAERQFAADASHQLRTPLTALSMRLEEIELLTDSAEVLEEARLSLEQIERLSSTINELLGRSSREGQSEALEALRLVDITDQQATEWQPPFAAAQRPLKFDVPNDLGVLATPGALSQVIATLLENSLKHGGGTTTVQASKSAGGVSIQVADEGAGVSDELAPHIFERHVTSGGGTGLGLALARDLAAHDGGRLELAQRRPAVFRLFLRAAPPAELPPGEVVELG
ncbi:MAG: HAMP domain-containing histidine kinase [Bifidobacteriaceae bacterium]|jgi:signal transduction histidine kinase|nr:HAMP domain-containing histidine kinase [Bifidobacteriaceae bacterium]